MNEKPLYLPGDMVKVEYVMYGEVHQWFIGVIEVCENSNGIWHYSIAGRGTYDETMIKKYDIVLLGVR